MDIIIAFLKLAGVALAMTAFTIFLVYFTKPDTSNHIECEYFNHHTGFTVYLTNTAEQCSEYEEFLKSQEKGWSRTDD